MNDQELQKIIQEAARIRATTLNLRDNQLTSLPPELAQLSNLTTLYLSHNQLTTLPPELAQLSNLTTLNLRDNQLTSLPPELAQLTNLITLNLSYNQLTSLPPELAQLTNLTWLYLSNNQLTSLPPELAQLTNLTWLYLSHNQLTTLPPELAQLTHLTGLYLSHNQLTTLPPELAQLSNLTTFYLGDNQLTTLPPELAQLTNLTTLYLSHNQLRSLPPEIAQLTNLTELDLRNNQLTSLPPEIAQLRNLIKLELGDNQLTRLPTELAQLSNLQELRLYNNQLSALPPEMAHLSKLKQLYLRDNPLPIPPEILAKHHDPQAILNYYVQLLRTQEKKPLNEAKMLLVGQGSVGKTSLVKRLVQGEYNPQENKTEGIAIQPWQILVQEQEIRLNVWDFGGQEIMHATHQFFLTQRSLYLLVLDARLEEEENRLDYWLKMIHSFGGDSPAIIVGNKVDQQPLSLDRRGLQQKYPNIRAFVETSCCTNHGLETLKTAIQQEVGALPHLHDPLLFSWFQVKAKLEQMQQDYIPYSEYEQLCTAEEVADPTSQRTLIGFLHDLGIVLNFQDDLRLQDTNILNPLWVTQGVYKILNDNLLMTHHQGILALSMLRRILDPKVYPCRKHLFLMDMMRKFELCFALEDSADPQFLIPDLLTKEEPYTGDWQEVLAFQYHYPVLPGSILSRLIVRMNAHIHQKTYWRSGVVLASRGNTALVRADREDKRIFISVNGDRATRRELLARIRAQFHEIHQTIPGLEVEEKIPLPTQPAIAVDYEHLLTLEEMGEVSFIPEGSRERVKVKDLLDGIEREGDRRSRHQRYAEDRDPAYNRDKSVNVIINNQITQETSMSDIRQAHSGSGDNIGNVGGDKVGRDKIGTQINASQNLAQAAQDIKALLDQLSLEYPSNTTAGQMTIATKAVEKIEKNPTLKARVINALKEGGATALEEAVDHPAVKVVVAAAKGFMED